MLSKLKKFYESNRILLRFYLLFAYFVAFLYLALHLDISHRYLAESFPAFIASSVSVVMNLMGQATHSFGQTVRVDGGMSFKVIYHCSGLFLMSIFAAAVLAYPATSRQKLIGLLLGLPILFCANVVRLSVLGVVGKYYPEYFDLSHEYLWQGLLIVFVIFLWSQWRDRFVGAEGPLTLVE